MNKEFIDKYRFEFEELESALRYSQTICPPDQYQMRQNALSLAIAKFLLKPYEDFLKEKRKLSND